MSEITYTLTNTNTTDNIEIRYFTFVDDANASHVADLSGVGGTGGYTDNNTLKVRNKTYDTGGYLRKRYTNDSHTRIGHYSTHTGSTLTLKNDTGHLTDYPNGVQAGWVVDQIGSPFDGLTVTNVISNTSLVMSGPPAFLPTFGESIEFSTTTYVVILQNTTGLAPGWAITENGYTPPPSGAPAYIIDVIDSTSVQVNRLPDTTPIYNNGAYTYFTSSTNFLTLNESTANLGTGYSASGNGYDGSQSIISIVDGNTVIMSDLPSSVPTSGNTITFTDQAPQYILPPLGYGTFTVDYTTPTHTVGTNYPGTVTINARKSGSPINKIAYTFVNISSPPAIPPTFPGGGGAGNGGGSGGNGQSWSVVTQTFDDGSTLTTVTNDVTGLSYTISTDATDAGITSASDSDPGSSIGEGNAGDANGVSGQGGEGGGEGGGSGSA
jgi:hypothetical protein